MIAGITDLEDISIEDENKKWLGTAGLWSAMPSLASRFEWRSTRLARAANKRLVSPFHNV